MYGYGFITLNRGIALFNILPFYRTEDNKGNSIKETKKGRFHENPVKNDLSVREVIKSKKKVFNDTKESEYK